MAIVLDGTNGVTTNSGTLISATTIGVGGATPSTSGAGITFPATQSASTDANTLDDYEEGTFTPTVAGYYQINAGLTFGSTVSYAQIFIYKNGSSYRYNYLQSSASNYSVNISSIVYCNGTTDYIEIYGYVNATTPTFLGGSEATWFNGSMIRGA